MSLRNTSLLFLCAVLVVGLAWVAHEVQSLTDNEALLEEVYDRQLDTILYSVNQHAWDVASTWAGRLDAAFGAALAEEAGAGEALSHFVSRTPAVRAVFMMDGQGGWVIYGDPEVNFGEHVATVDLQELRARLAERLDAGYRQLYPLALEAADEQATVALFFVPDLQGPAASATTLGGLVLDSDGFVQHVMRPKMEEVARERLAVTLTREAGGEAVFSTGDPSADGLQRERKLWMFPGYRVGIRPEERSLEGILRGRFYRSMGLIALLTLALAGGGWFVYRNTRRAVQLAGMRTAFVSNVSHELRTPLALIRMYAETLEMGRVPTEARRQAYYRIIHHETERLSRLVNNILNFSQIEAGRKAYASGPVDLNDVVRGVLPLYEFHLAQHGFETDVRLADGLPPVRGDAEALTEAVVNLIDNAVKYSLAQEAGARYLGLTTGCTADGVYVEVADRGMGIPAAEQERIFEQFYRISDGLVHNTKGSGLGLSLVKHIAEAHGGTIGVVSRPGAGSRFRLTLPAAVVSEPVQDASAPVTLEANTRP